MIEPVAWMVTNEDGQDAYVTADPTLAKAGQRALPLYTLDRKDVLILELYREQHGEALTDDALARVMVASEDELNAALKLEGKDPEDTARLSGQAIQIATLTHERDQLRAEVEALRADSALLDWMQRQSLDDFAVGLVVDAPHDGDFWCSPDTGGMYYGKTLREAMLAARKG